MLMEVRPVKRLTRVEQQQRTREALLDAAIELFVARGIEGTSIEEVTAQAGFTRGAFYSNFSDKNDLVLATGKHFLELLHAAARAEDPDDDVGQAYRDRLARMQPVAAGGATVFLAEIALYALRHEEVAEGIALLHQQQLAPAVAFVRARLQAAGIKKPANVSYEMLANIMQSLTFGLDLFGRVDPQIEPEKAIAVATKALLQGLQ